MCVNQLEPVLQWWCFGNASSSFPNQIMNHHTDLQQLFPFNEVVWQAFALAGAQDDGTVWCLGGGTWTAALYFVAYLVSFYVMLYHRASVARVTVHLRDWPSGAQIEPPSVSQRSIWGCCIAVLIQCFRKLWVLVGIIKLPRTNLPKCNNMQLVWARNSFFLQQLVTMISLYPGYPWLLKLKYNNSPIKYTHSCWHFCTDTSMHPFAPTNMGILWQVSERWTGLGWTEDWTRQSLMDVGTCQGSKRKYIEEQSWRSNLAEK